MILAGDVGATKILLEAGELRSDRWEPLLDRRYSTAEAENFATVLEGFLAECERAGVRRLKSAAIGVAGVPQANKVKMTHHAWSVDGDAIARRFAIPRVKVVNDLAATANGLDLLRPSEIVTIQPGKASPGDPRVVIGVGTGLGIAYLIPEPGGGYRELASEGGHAGFAPATPAQLDVWRAIFTQCGRVSAEDIVSGRGLPRIHAALCGRHVMSEEMSAEDVAIAAEKGDACSVQALDLFSECLGNVAGDHALALLARGGVFLAGGVIAKLLPKINKARFREAFCAKSPHSAMMMKIPVKAAASERAAILGAAKIAAAR
jgi:glucokinase